MGKDYSVNGFIFPNSIIDELLPELSHSELKCYLVVLRKTKGWNKEEDYISVSQFMKLTGLSNRSIIDACESLVKRGILRCKTGERNTKIYTVNSYKSTTSEKSSLVKNFHSTSEKSSPVTSEKFSHTKNNNKNTIQNKTPLPPTGESTAVSDQNSADSAELQKQADDVIAYYNTVAEQVTGKPHKLRDTAPVKPLLKGTADRKPYSADELKTVVRFALTVWDKRGNSLPKPKNIFRPTRFDDYLADAELHFAKAGEQAADDDMARDVAKLYNEILGGVLRPIDEESLDRRALDKITEFLNALSEKSLRAVEYFLEDFRDNAGEFWLVKMNNGRGAHFFNVVNVDTLSRVRMGAL